MLLNKVACEAGRTRQDFQQPGALATGADFAAAKKVALGDYAQKVSLLIHHGKPADMAAQHNVGGVEHRRVRADSNHVLGHNLMCAHALSFRSDWLNMRIRGMRES